MSRLKILITSGATREPIDGVRYISNVSTGKTGARLAEFFSEIGFSVTYLHGEGAVEPHCLNCDNQKFSDYQSLDLLMQKELGTRDYFAVIHLAAVSDYSVAKVVMGEREVSPSELRKIDSGEELGLILKRNTKILDRLKAYSSARKPLVVGFKLTNGASEVESLAAVEKVARSGQVDFVIHNDWSQVAESRAESSKHLFQFFKIRGTEVVPGRRSEGTEELGAAMVEGFREYL